MYKIGLLAYKHARLARVQYIPTIPYRGSASPSYNTILLVRHA